MGCGLCYKGKVILHTLSTFGAFLHIFLNRFLHSLSTFFLVYRAHKLGFTHIYIALLTLLLMRLYNTIVVRDVSV